MKSQTDPSARCDECGHPYSEHRGKRGCERIMKPSGLICPCPRFKPERTIPRPAR